MKTFARAAFAVAVCVAAILFLSVSVPPSALTGRPAVPKPPPKTFQVIPPEDKALGARAKAILPTILRACPGLYRYADDLSQASVRPSIMSGFEGGITFEFEVAANPKQLPPPLKVRSASNHCFIEVSSDGSHAYIGKRACHSICDGVWKENSLGLMGREFNL